MGQLRSTVALALLAATATRADVLADWTEVAIQAATAAKQPSFVQTRTLAMVHVAMFEAINGIEGRYRPYRSKPEAKPGSSAEAAAAAAAHDVLLATVPEQASILEAAFERSLGQVTDAEARSNGVALGRRAAASIVALRASDGAGAPNVYRPVTTPGAYVPTASVAGSTWGKVTPWAMDKGTQFRPGPPTPLKSAEWGRDYNEVKSLGGKTSTARTAAQTEAARFWEMTGPGAYKEVVRSAVGLQGRSLVQNARLLALASMAQADSYIAVFDAKYAYNFWRPVTAVRNGDLDGNDVTALDPGWQPLIDTPMHPEYPCAHCINVAAVVAVLERELGRGAHLRSTSSSLPGVTHSWNSGEELIDEVSNARIWGGIHYRNSAVVGAAMGRRVGELVVERCLRPVP